MVLRINHVNDLGECKMSNQLAIALIYTKAQFRSSHLLSWHLFWVELAKYPYVQLHVPFMHMAFSSPLLVQLIVWLQMEPRTKIHKIQLSLSFIEPSGEFALKKEHWKTANFGDKIEIPKSSLTGMKSFTLHFTGWEYEIKFQYEVICLICWYKLYCIVTVISKAKHVHYLHISLAFCLFQVGHYGIFSVAYVNLKVTSFNKTP